MYKFAIATAQLEWIKDDVKIPFDISYMNLNNEMANDKLKTLINALETLNTSLNTGFTLAQNAPIEINVGDPINYGINAPQMTISFQVEKNINYYSNFISVSATRDDFYDYVDLYGLSEALNKVFNLALDELGTSENLKFFLPTSLIVQDNLTD